MEEKQTLDIEIIKSLLESLIQEVYEKLNKEIEDNLAEIIRKIEVYEQQIASIVYAYGEQAVVLDALATQVSYSSQEAQEAFSKQLIEKRKLMFEVINDAASGFVDGEDSGLGQAIRDMGEKNLPSSN